MEKQYTVFYYAAKQPGLSVQFKIKDRVEDALRDFKIVQLKLDKEQIAALDTKIILEPEPISKDEVDSSRLTSAIAAVIGMSMGFIMYMTVFIYGMYSSWICYKEEFAFYLWDSLFRLLPRLNVS